MARDADGVADAPPAQPPAKPVPPTGTPPPIRYGQLVFVTELAALLPTGERFVPARAKAPPGCVLVMMPIGETSLDGRDPIDLDARMAEIGWVRKDPPKSQQLVMPSGQAVTAIGKGRR